MNLAAVHTAQMFSGMSPHSWAVTGWMVTGIVGLMVIGILIWRDRPNP